MYDHYRQQRSRWEAAAPGTWLKLHACTPLGDTIGSPFWTRVWCPNGNFDSVESVDLGGEACLSRQRANYKMLRWAREPHGGYGAVTEEWLNEHSTCVDESRFPLWLPERRRARIEHLRSLKTKDGSDT